MIPVLWPLWQQGRTGYPIVDAGMRELWATGYMHNRVRMIAASFLIKHLLIDWREGERWFWDTLVDADIANNSASWQWVAGSGADAAPYFRIFNPVLQGEKFDPQGLYIRKWCPELSTLPDRLIHEPWKADSNVKIKYSGTHGGSQNGTKPRFAGSQITGLAESDRDQEKWLPGFRPIMRQILESRGARARSAQPENR